ncbi:hypothetical protein ACWD0J_11410 [Streptomyces sp. NPDC003011]
MRALTIGTREPHGGTWEFAPVAVGAAAVQVEPARHRQRIGTAPPGHRGVAATAEGLGLPVTTAPASSIAAAERISPQQMVR